MFKFYHLFPLYKKKNGINKEAFLLIYEKTSGKTPGCSQGAVHSGSRGRVEMLHSTSLPESISRQPLEILSRVQISGKCNCGLKTTMCEHVRIIWLNIQIIKRLLSERANNSSFTHRFVIVHTNIPAIAASAKAYNWTRNYSHELRMQNDTTEPLVFLSLAELSFLKKICHLKKKSAIQAFSTILIIVLEILWVPKWFCVVKQYFP